MSHALDEETAAVVRRGLVQAALRAGRAGGMTVARSVVDSPEIAAALASAGFTVVDRVRRYTYSGSR